MSKKGNFTNENKVEKLLKWKKRPFLDKMIDDGVSGNQCLKWCNENGFKISVATMYKYINMRKQSIIEGVTMEALMKSGAEVDMEKLNPKDEEVKKELPKKRRNTTKNMSRGEKIKASRDEVRKQKVKTVNKVKSDMELLDAVIQKGMETLAHMEAVAPQTAIKAIELKHRITGGKHQGFTTYGLEEIRLREKARENAILVVMLEYIPEEKHDEVIERMEQATKEYYESLGLGEAYAKAMEEDEQEDEGDVASV